MKEILEPPETNLESSRRDPQNTSLDKKLQIEHLHEKTPLHYKENPNALSFHLMNIHWSDLSILKEFYLLHSSLILFYLSQYILKTTPLEYFLVQTSALMLSLGLSIATCFVKSDQVYFEKKVFLGIYLNASVAFLVSNPKFLSIIFDDGDFLYFNPTFLALILLEIIAKNKLFGPFFSHTLWNWLVISVYITTSFPDEWSEFASIFLEVVLFIMILHYNQKHSLRKTSILKSSLVSPTITTSRAEAKTIFEKIMENLKEGLELSKPDLDPIEEGRLSQISDILEHILETITSTSDIYKTDIKAITKDMDETEKKYIYEILNYKSRFQPFPRKKARVVTKKTEEVFKIRGLEESELHSILKKLGKNFDFDIFFLSTCTNGSPLLSVGTFLITKYSLNEILRVKKTKITSFFTKLEASYKQNPYHTSTHAADVMASYSFFVHQSELAIFSQPLEMLASTIAVLGHDAGHFGLNNRFLINSKHHLAIRYNDNSVLENMHISTIYEILSDPEFNILENLDEDDWQNLRQIVIEMILVTDMVKHFGLLDKSRIRLLNFVSLEDPEYRHEAMILAMKAADIGHTAKKWDEHKIWTKLIVEEFFMEGDIEREEKMKISFPCDRYSIDVNKSQAGFLKTFSLPLYETLGEFLRSSTFDEICVEEVRENIEKWEESYYVEKAKSEIEFGLFEEKEGCDSVVPKSSIVSMGSMRWY